MADDSLQQSRNPPIKTEDEDVPMLSPKIENVGENDTTTLAMRNRLTELDNVLNPVPQKRGRAVGSGAGEKRKADDAYSQNPHTIRARKRAKNMTSAEDELRRVQNNLTSAISKAKKKVRSQAGFDQLPLGVQEKKLDNAEAAVRARKEDQGYTEQVVRSKFQLEYDHLEYEIAQQDKHFVRDIKRRHSNLDDNDDLFWESDDDIDDEEEGDFGQDFLDFQLTDIGEATLAAIEDWELKKATPMQLAEARAGGIAAVGRAMAKGTWKMFQQSVRDRLGAFATKELYLGKIIDEQEGWEKLASLNKSTPERFFSKSDKALLRFATANIIASHRDQDGWVDLPGPASWWPDITGRAEDKKRDRKAARWYMRHGFDILDDEIREYVLAANALQHDAPPVNWLNSLAHDDMELIWSPFRQGDWRRR